jgi:hypothetical protein
MAPPASRWAISSASWEPADNGAAVIQVESGHVEDIVQGVGGGILAFALLYAATIRFYFADVTARDAAAYTPRQRRRQRCRRHRHVPGRYRQEHSHHPPLSVLDPIQQALA